MKASGAMVQGALAACGLVAAYVTWQREPDLGAGDVVVLDASKADLDRIRYDDPHRWVEIERRSEGGEPAFWIREGTKEEPAPDAGLRDGGAQASAGDGGVTLASATVPSPVKPIREVRGNEQAEKLFERFSPLRASRGLGVLEAGKLKELGLDKPEQQIDVSVRGTGHAFAIGTSALGVSNPYLKSVSDGRVFLVKGTLVSDLEFAATRLVDRRLHLFKPEDWDELSVAFGDQTTALVQVGGKLAPKKSPGQPEEFAKNWHDRIWRMVVVEALGKDEHPPAGEPRVEVRVDYKGHGRALGFLEMGHAGGEVFARTEHTAGWVKVPANMGDTLLEAKKVISGS